MALADYLKPVMGIVIVLVLAPLIIAQFGEISWVIDEAFNGTIDMGGVQVDAGGLAKLILFFASITIVLGMTDRFLR